MSQREFTGWMDFYRAHPFDDLHRFHRPAALIAQSMAGGDIAPRLNWLAPQPPDPALEGFDEADRNTLAAFGLRPPQKG